MPTILVSHNERKRVKEALGDCLEATLPFDFLLYTRRGPIPRERKTVSDLIASLQDGRLAKECAAMREASQYPGVIIEGKFCYSSKGYLKLGSKETHWTRRGIRNMLRTIRYVEGCDIELSLSIADTAELLKETYSWFESENHYSTRSQPRVETEWLVPTYQERFQAWLQHCGGNVSVVRAKALSKVYGSPMQVFNATIEELEAVPGIGEVTAGAIYRFLRGG